MISEAQQVQTCDCNRNPLQLVDRVELDQGGVVFYTLVGDSGGHEKSMGELYSGWKNLRRATSCCIYLHLTAFRSRSNPPIRYLALSVCNHLHNCFSRLGV